jgi:hypothetical protein
VEVMNHQGEEQSRQEVEENHQEEEPSRQEVLENH